MPLADKLAPLSYDCRLSSAYNCVCKPSRGKDSAHQVEGYWSAIRQENWAVSDKRGWSHLGRGHLEKWKGLELACQHEIIPITYLILQILVLPQPSTGYLHCSLAPSESKL